MIMLRRVGFVYPTLITVLKRNLNIAYSSIWDNIKLFRFFPIGKYWTAKVLDFLNVIKSLSLRTPLGRSLNGLLIADQQLYNIVCIVLYSSSSVYSRNAYRQADNLYS